LKRRWISWIGFAAIVLGTGGIKPCVAAFGGDQFGPGQEKQLQKFFSFFYISINAGGLLSIFITPILREDVHCFERTDCFPLAFGMSSVLMIVALAFFLLGRAKYKIIPPSKDNMVVQVVSCVFVSYYY
jgi:solute carrier family 15 oligopeptide transporter 1